MAGKKEITPTGRVKSKGLTVIVSIRMKPDMLNKIDDLVGKPGTFGKNRNDWIIDACRAKLEGDTKNEISGNLKSEKEELEFLGSLTDKEKKDVINGAKNMSDLLRNEMFHEMERRSGFLQNMSDEDFAKLVVGRLPKDNGDKTPLEEQALSLKACLREMPDIPDITASLNGAKGELARVCMERDINICLLNYERGKLDLEALINRVYSFAVMYATDCVARNNLPGYGDGGGLTPKEYDDIAEAVRKRLMEIQLYKNDGVVSEIAADAARKRMESEPVKRRAVKEGDIL